MKVLHLSSSYPYTDLYKNLLQELDEKEINQIMYVSVKKNGIKNKRLIEKNLNTKYIFSSVYNNLDRYIYYTKIKKIYSDIKSKVNLNKVDLVHTHFLFSDGGVAYKIKKEYGIDYIVAIRNSDVNFFFRYGFHIRRYGIEILREAKKIVFLSPEYKKNVLEKYVPSQLKSDIEAKSYIIPNGIDLFWLSNIYKHKEKKINFKKINLIFVGELNKNKNIINSINAVILLLKKGFEVNFNIIGKGPLENEIRELINTTKKHGNIHLCGYVEDKNELLKLYRDADIYLMPSFHETFGLVYIEAMSQGLPVIFSKGQGIDGYFSDGEVGYSVNPNSPLDIALKVEAILEKYNKLSISAINRAEFFNWKTIAEEYIDHYRDILK